MLVVAYTTEFAFKISVKYFERAVFSEKTAMIALILAVGFSGFAISGNV